jgi:hypothetical protein
MANPEHLEILKQGADAWNQWRAANPGATPELMGADLRSAEYTQMDCIDLGGADLFQALLQNAHMQKADLRQGGPAPGKTGSVQALGSETRVRQPRQCRGWDVGFQRGQPDEGQLAGASTCTRRT